MIEPQKSSPTDDNASGFNIRLHEHYYALPEHYMLNSFYPDGSSFEDVYSYFSGIREGSFRLLSHIVVAVKSLVTLAFAVSFARPPRCMNNGNAANAWATHLAAASSVVPTTLCFDTSSLQLHYLACSGDSASAITRITTHFCMWWIQSVIQIILFGGQHSSTAESPQGIAPTIKKQFKKSYYATRWGFLMARSTFQSPQSLVQPYFFKFGGSVLTPTPFCEHQHHHFHKLTESCALRFTSLSILLPALSILMPLPLLLLLFVAPSLLLLQHG